MKKIILYLLMLLGLLSLTACGKTAAPEAEEPGYILSAYTALPDSITNISGGFLQEDKIFLACWEEADVENSAYYIAVLSTDGSDFEKLPLDFGGADIPLDIAPDGQGGLWCLYMTPSKDEAADYSLCRCSRSGGRVAEVPLNSVMEEADALRYAGRMLFLNADDKGNLCVTVKNARTYCFLFNSEGKFLFSLKDSGNPMNAITTATGQMAVCSSKGGGSTFSLLPIDMDGRDWDKPIELGAVDKVFDGVGDTSCYLYAANELYACSLSARTNDKLFTWSNLGLSSGDTHIFPLSDGRFAIVAGSFSQTQLLSYEFCIVEPGVDERTVLTMLSLNPDASIREAVALFNKSSREFRVELTSYSSLYPGASASEWDNAVMKLNIELISGKVPDLIDLSGLPADAYLRHGLLEDLYPYLLGDSAINLDDYYANIFDAMSIDGKLPYVTNSVRIFTMFADANAVGTKRGWTVNEFAQLKNDGRIIVEGLEPSRFLQMLVAADTRFVDWESGECRFDSEEFVNLLELCKSMADCEDSAQFVSDGSQANCIYTPLFSALFVAQSNARLAGNANPIGFPNATGEVMHIMDAANRIGLSAACEHKDGAWAFVRLFLEPRLQESGIYFPFLKSSFEKIADASVKGNTIWRGGMYDGEIREEDIALAREILGSTGFCGNSDQRLVSLISEIAESYFNDSRTAQEVSADIQRRARLYIDEHR